MTRPVYVLRAAAFLSEAIRDFGDTWLAERRGP
jgi:hypothetical protein